VTERRVLNVLLILTACATPAAARWTDEMPSSGGSQRVVIVLLDGFGIDYGEASDMLLMKGLARQGFAKNVRAVMPTVTNVNNASLCTGALPETHGITGNSYHDEARIGDLVVLGDKATVFGETDAESVALPANFRSHGSIHEESVPRVVYNPKRRLPPAAEIEHGFQLTRLFCGAAD
jgi:hypothetical protein